MIKLTLEFNDMKYNLDDPISISRSILFEPDYKSSGAFYLPRYKTSFFEVDGFIGDIERGGSCRVEIHSYSPHNLTHIETSAHIVKNGKTINELPLDLFSGIVFMVDCSNINKDYIYWEDIKDKIPKNISRLAIKTKSSLLNTDFDFTNKNFIALHPNTAKELFKQNINVLILDLPSADSENDGGKLLAHRNYFGLPKTGHLADNFSEKIQVELAHFSNLQEGMYYYVTTPPRTQTDAQICDIWFYKLVSEQ